MELSAKDGTALTDAVTLMRKWRHYA